MGDASQRGRFFHFTTDDAFAAGIDATHVSEIGYSRADDIDIIALARERGDIIVTKDADFHAELAITGATGPSTIFSIKMSV